MKRAAWIVLCAWPSAAWAVEGDELLGLLGRETEDPDVSTLLENAEAVEVPGVDRFEKLDDGVVVDVSDGIVLSVGLIASGSYQQEDGDIVPARAYARDWPLGLPGAPDWGVLENRLGEPTDVRGAIGVWNFAGVVVAPMEDRNGDVGVVWFELSDPLAGTVDVESVRDAAKKARPSRASNAVDTLIYAGVGWGAWYLSDSALNGVTQQWDASNNWADGLDGVGIGNGLSLSVAYLPGAIGLEVGVSTRAGATSATGTPPTFTQEVEQQVRLSEVGIEAMAAWAPVRSASNVLDLALGLGAASVTMKHRDLPTREEWRTDSTIEPALVVQARYAQAFARTGGFGVAVKPSFRLGLGSRDYADAYGQITTEPPEDSGAQKGGAWAAGLALEAGWLAGS